MALPWCRQDVEQGNAADKPRRFQWGYITRDGEPISWYILIRLPSYVMQQAFWRWDGEPTWHQRCLLFREKLPASIGEWMMTEIECEH
jgi:uncharacterized protein (DUF2126 family)